MRDVATAEQIKSLIRSHLNNQPEQFFTIALQVAAHEAQQDAHDTEKFTTPTFTT